MSKQTNLKINEKDQLHPDDKRNLIIFIIVSLVLWFGFDHFVLQPKVEAARAAKEAALKAAAADQSVNHMADAADKVLPRADVIAAQKRINLGNDMIFGTMALKGGRIDDVSLADYFVTLKKKDHVALFSPAGSEHAEYADFGWMPASGSAVKTPNKDSVWQLSGTNADLAPGRPVTLTWDNGQGLLFERTYSLDKKFMFTVKRRVINNSGAPVTLYPYALMAQNGYPSDYLHRWVVFEGLQAYVGKDLKEFSYDKMVKQGKAEFSGQGGWMAFSDHYWLTSLIPAQDQDMKYSFRYTPDKSGDKKKVGRYQIDMTGAARTVQPGAASDVTSHLYVGTKNLKTIEAYGKDLKIGHFDLTVDFGLFYFLTKPFYHILMFFAHLTGNFGLAILCLTLCVRILVFPLANTTYRSFAGMAKMGPEMQEIKKHYGEDKARMQEELVKLYEREKVNPMAGCLPMLIQIPVLFSVYKVLAISLEMRHAPFFGWIHDLSAPDPTTVFNLFGLIPWTPPHALMFGAWSCAMLFFMILQKKLTPPPSDKMQNYMMYFFPYFISYTLSKFPSGLVIYWTFSNGLSVLQQYIIMRRAGADIFLFKSKTEKERMLEKREREMEEVREKAKKRSEGQKQGETEKDDAPTQTAPVSKPKPKKKKKKK